MFSIAQPNGSKKYPVTQRVVALSFLHAAAPPYLPDRAGKHRSLCLVAGTPPRCLASGPSAMNAIT
jgi:hypothetical protein